MYANVRNARIRCGDSTSFAMSGFSAWICWTIEPIGSSTSGIQRSSTSGMAGLWLLPAGPPGDLGGCEEKQHREQAPQGRFGQGFGHLGAADGGPDRGDADHGGGLPAHVAVALVPPDADENGRDDREQRGRL